MSDASKPTSEQIARIVAASPSITEAAIGLIQHAARQVNVALADSRIEPDSVGAAWLRTIGRTLMNDPSQDGWVFPSAAAVPDYGNTVGIHSPAAAPPVAAPTHGDHDFEPGIDTDMAAEGRSPDPRWCNVCGESVAAPTPAEPTEAETRTWHATGPRASAFHVRMIVAWIKANGGDARYEPRHIQIDPVHRDPRVTQPARIVITGPNGDVIVRPGDTVRMGGWFCEGCLRPVVPGQHDRREGQCWATDDRREFTVTPATEPTE